MVMLMFVLCIVVAGVLGALGVTARRASWDWQYQLRVIRALSVIATNDEIGGPLDLWEVELVGERPCADSLSVTIAPVDRPRDIGVLILEAPLAEMAARCTLWRDAGTPLLLNNEALGSAVVHGPDGCLIGRMAQRRDLEPFHSSPPW
jgi:hypothetical protein